MAKFNLFVLGLILILNSTLYAASWSVYYPKTFLPTNITTNSVYLLTDKEYLFDIDDMHCGVTKISLVKNLKQGINHTDYYSEERDLYCYVTKDTRVSITVNYRLQDTDCFEHGQMTIQRKDKGISPALFVQCKEY